MTTCIRARRRGFTILETGIVVTLVGLLITVMVVLFSSVLKAQRQVMLRERQRREFVRLDALLRSDVHAATKAAIKSPNECELTSSDGYSWTYDKQDSWLVRTHAQGGRTLQRESFFLRPGSEVHFQLSPAGSRSLVQLKLEPEPDGRPGEHHQPRYFAQVLLGGALPPVREEPQP
ncbi:hypothetical protein ETAA8_49730 [Anatilimnocola aggregata]|uniref:Type II secretion system protein n=1 Tax=Anatilimnocola aggregata TaxID=2528021 RepID=A0A517YHZ1_9BACT|nr:type II secretion system protein [Anatilimnocola aggregata]QDU29857.1 hypothetical protein ETAA8_49730 [Anatilimnocola aggregata]